MRRFFGGEGRLDQLADLLKRRKTFPVSRERPFTIVEAAVRFDSILDVAILPNPGKRT